MFLRLWKQCLDLVQSLLLCFDICTNLIVCGECIHCKLFFIHHETLFEESYDQDMFLSNVHKLKKPTCLYSCSS